MWGDHENGFPQPRGCFIHKDVTNSDVPVWEAYIVFNERNGLAQNTYYQVVLQTKFNITIKKIDLAC